MAYFSQIQVIATICLMSSAAPLCTSLSSFGIYNDQLDSICRFALCVIQLPWFIANYDRDVHGSRIGAFSCHM